MALRSLPFLRINGDFRNCYGLSKRLLSSSSKETKEDAVPSVIRKSVKDLLMNKEEQLYQEATKGTITVSSVEDVGLVSGVPEDHIKTRRVRIFCPAKSAMQSGTNNIHFWQIDFDTRERWENPLMGWTSTGDPMSNIKVEFASETEAIAHCEKMGWEYYIQKPNVNNPKPRSYGTNFAWNKRTRVSTK
ncbi:NADH dehydrogenase [ubiquinone] iron-sulfur protein 4, mitochondrial [Hylaeus volcanicus]|uniref:NADH dehydrogenase [ubiquinone] iron-sulfur protein 4, mitochondrial n=1 Tax=Hylaeus volcanicus TaxID=313075 RepID=UPI0023B78606|nr:NADH dehydrogenase [ubiquinone] iron-sulfur protein 4, mitochondrial [Hylaeus volcanicus]